MTDLDTYDVEENQDEAWKLCRRQVEAAVPELQDLPNPKVFRDFLLQGSSGSIPCAPAGLEKLQEHNGPHELFVEAQFAICVSRAITRTIAAPLRSRRSWLYYLITFASSDFSTRLPLASNPPSMDMCFPCDVEPKGIALCGRPFTADLVAKTNIAVVLYAAVEEEDMQAAKSRVEESVPQNVGWKLESLCAVPVCALAGTKLEFGCHDPEGQVTWTGQELDIDTVAGRGNAIIALVQMYRL